MNSQMLMLLALTGGFGKKSDDKSVAELIPTDAKAAVAEFLTDMTSLYTSSKTLADVGQNLVIQSRALKMVGDLVGESDLRQNLRGIVPQEVREIVNPQRRDTGPQNPAEPAAGDGD